MRQEGGCICGDIRYRVSGQPERVTVCHCRFCQRATGSGFLIEPVFRRHNFEILSGNLKTFVHRSERSGNSISINFCSECGTKLYFDLEGRPDFVWVFGGTFDDPNFFALSPDNTKYIFLNYARSGTIIPCGFSAFAEHVSELDGTPVEPTVFADHHVIE